MSAWALSPVSEDAAKNTARASADLLNDIFMLPSSVCLLYETSSPGVGVRPQPFFQQAHEPGLLLLIENGFLVQDVLHCLRFYPALGRDYLREYRIYRGPVRLLFAEDLQQAFPLLDELLTGAFSGAPEPLLLLPHHLALFRGETEFLRECRLPLLCPCGHAAKILPVIEISRGCDYRKIEQQRD